MDKPSKPIRQHYVPQAYLRRFAPDPSRNRIWIYDRIVGKAFPQSILNTCSQNLFYDCTGLRRHVADGGIIELPDVFLEYLMKQFEDSGSPAIQKLIELTEQSAVAGPTLSSEFLLYLAVQVIRTEGWRQLRQNAITGIWRQYLGKHLDPSSLDELIASRAKTGHKWEMIGLNSLRDVVSNLHSHVYLVGENATGLPLYTSDNPVVQFTSADDLLTGLSFCYPLTPKLLLLGYYRADPTLVHNRHGIIPLDEEAVYRYNFMQFKQCTRQVVIGSDNLTHLQRIIHAGTQ